MLNFDAPALSRLKIISPLVGAYILFNVVSFATLLLEVPLVRLWEQSICNRHYQESPPSTFTGHNVEESLCKIAAVQDELAMVAGWQLSLNALAGEPLRYWDSR